MAATLGVPTFQYLPWAVLNYMGIIVAIVLAVTGFGVTKLNDEERLKFKTAFGLH